MGDSQPKRIEERLARELGLALILLALALVQVTLLTGPAGFSIPLLLVLAIARALVGAGTAEPVRGLMRGLWWAFYGGVALDLLSTMPLGSHALAHLLAVAVVGLAARRFAVERPLVPLLAVAFGTVIYEATLALIVLPAIGDWQTYALIVVLPSVLLALIPTLPVVAMIHRLARAGG
ncbi:rod shape-determining protein MreD [Chloroflexus sp.]|uniref:rod shape-determining protein MreD n=1 Tax=Chloroflexus sp. TaxID=1904827 RepID=UPI00298F3AD0|nr:rod shape-determining protein MreD [Chloroflexus sp.]MDW8405169.1 rod shape-determining protein MreD [Chloroflexus sp.]